MHVQVHTYSYRGYLYIADKSSASRHHLDASDGPHQAGEKEKNTKETKETKKTKKKKMRKNETRREMQIILIMLDYSLSLSPIRVNAAESNLLYGNCPVNVR